MPGQFVLETNVELPTHADLDQLLLIRHFEETLLELFAAGEVSGTTHTCLGQEYIPVALGPLLNGDFIFSNHRGHGHYIAHGGDPEDLLAEIMGRQGAPCRGVGGSQHLSGKNFVSSGVQGESLPIAVGVALHFKRTTPNILTAAYIGDGTWGEGSVYEALNMARLWQLPLIVIVENNQIAQSTPAGAHLAGTVSGRASAFGIDFLRIRTIDIRDIRRQLAPLIARARAQHRPLVIEFDTIRLGPHSKGDDTRTPQELERLRERDWYVVYGSLAPERFAAVEARQRQRVADIVEAVRQRPLSGWRPY